MNDIKDIKIVIKYSCEDEVWYGMIDDPYHRTLFHRKSLKKIIKKLGKELKFHLKSLDELEKFLKEE